MNNAQFRDLVSDDKGKSASKNGSSATFTPRSLGSRGRASMPMTPRVPAGHNQGSDLRRQVAEHTRQSNGEPALKKFKSSYAPKGTKLAEGYQDRSQHREDGYNDETSREKKLHDLEKMLKDEKINQVTFDKLRDQMGIGGDLSTTHLVKGLDFKLLERMRRGEDVNTAIKTGQDEPSADVDEELDDVLGKEVEAKQKQEVSEESRPKSAPQSMTREEMLRRLKESRSAKITQTAEPEANLSEKFKKVPSVDKQGKKKFVESINGRRREVLLIIRKDGSTKRKTRWLDPESAIDNQNATPLGMEVPAEILAKQKAILEQQNAEDEDHDIFAGVNDYVPLRDLDESEDEASAEPHAQESKEQRENPQGNANSRNYFGRDDKITEQDTKFSIKDDPNLMAALKRAAALRQHKEQAGQGEETDLTDTDPDKEAKHKQFLAKLKQQAREDAEDMDLGFGESRYDDDDDQAPLYEGEEEQKNKRKRGPKKRKGDKNNVTDVMNVLEGRKK